MLLKIGELSKRTGLTVRALHHYDAIGLLTPTARTDAGYRLYNRHDIARLHQIQALRKFGLTLADIGTYLARPDLPFSSVIAEQIAQLTRQIEQATMLRSRLHDLQQQHDRLRLLRVRRSYPAAGSRGAVQAHGNLQHG